DPHARRMFWELIENIKKRNKTIVLTTHYMDEAEYLCEEIVIMDKGKIIESGNPENLLIKHFGGAVLKIPEKAFRNKIELSCPYQRDEGYIKVLCPDMDK